MKKLGMLLLMIITCISLSGCSSKPDPVVTSFCAAMQQYDFDTMKEYIVDGQEESMEDIFNDPDGQSEKTLSVLKECAAKMTFEIESSEITNNTAKVTVNFNYADLSPVIKEAFNEYMQQALIMAFSGADEEDLGALFEDIFSEKYSSAEITMITETVEFECEKTDDGWKISNVSNEILNVLTSNMFTGLEEVLSSFAG